MGSDSAFTAELALFILKKNKAAGPDVQDH